MSAEIITFDYIIVTAALVIIIAVDIKMLPDHNIFLAQFPAPVFLRSMLSRGMC